MFGRALSSIFAIPATFFIPLTTAYGEYEEYRVKNPTEQSSSRLLEIVYPILSIAFAPMTAFVPLEKATQSKGHMLSTLINIPHIVFTFFSYTGGRFLTLLKSLKLAFFNLSDDEKLRLENERKLVRTLGDIGSDNAAVTPEAHQFMTGWQTIKNLLTGNLSSVKENLSEAPVTTVLGTFIGSIFWIPTFIGKSFDTIIRTLEMSDQLKNAISENSSIYKFAKGAKEWWHTTAASKSPFGSILILGREFGKIMQAVASPMGMISVVFPVFDHFAHGFNNKEADEVGGAIKTIDRILNIGAFLSHLYFTTLYGLFVRLPQTVVTTTFYVCNTINRMRGVLDKPDDPRYLDPRKVRDAIFNPKKGWAKTVSDFAGDIIEKQTGRRFLYENIYKVLAEQECYRPLRETLYKEAFESEIQYKAIDPKTGAEVILTKQALKEPPAKLWAQILKENREKIIQGSRERFERYLKEAASFNEEQINQFFYEHKVNDLSPYGQIEKELKEIIDGEIKACSETNTESLPDTSNNGKTPFKKPKLKSKDFFDMLFNPFKYWDDIKEVFKFRTALAQLVLSPLNVLDFVNIVEMGDRTYPYWLSNFLLQESSIRTGDYGAGNTGELMSVYSHAVQTCGKGMANIYKAGAKILGKAA